MASCEPRFLPMSPKASLVRDNIEKVHIAILDADVVDRTRPITEYTPYELRRGKCPADPKGTDWIPYWLLAVAIISEEENAETRTELYRSTPDKVMSVIREYLQSVERLRSAEDLQ
jgi:hypothetical protein